MAAAAPAILLNIPGTAANAAACLDGYALARQGQAGRAMGIATTGSVVGSLFGMPASRCSRRCWERWR